jgi:ComF family protein
MARLMSARCIFDEDAVLVPVPTATSRVRQRGYDQAELLCRELASLTRLPYRTALARHGQSRQVGTNRTERRAHLEGALRVRHPETIQGKHVVLVDDVLTTGATIEAAAKVIRRAGAKRVDAIVFAQA